jgi:hypothetical protein
VVMSTALSMKVNSPHAGWFVSPGTIAFTGKVVSRAR